MDDPFSAVYTAIWDMAVSHPIINSFVREGNQIRLDIPSNRDPIKGDISTADVPELTLLPAGFVANLHRTSSSSSCIRTYSWVCTTGDFRVVEPLFPISWALYEASARWKDYLTPLEWQGQQFVKRCQIVNVAEGENDSERNRGFKGWSFLLNYEVEMHFNTKDLLN